MLVVSDSSPIRALGHLGLLDTLPALFEVIVVPPGVARELAASHPRFAPLRVDSLPFIRLANPADTLRVEELVQQVQRAEAEAIALAIELDSRLLMDEARGRRLAQALGRQTIGTLGVLGMAKERGLIGPVRPLVKRLIHEVRFFLDAELVETFLQRIGE